MTPLTFTEIDSPRRIRKQLLRDAQDHRLSETNKDVQDQVEYRFASMKHTLEMNFPEMAPAKIEETSLEVACFNRRDRRSKIVKQKKIRMKRKPHAFSKN